MPSDTSVKAPSVHETVDASPYAKPSYRGYVLGLLMLVYAFNFIDRQLLVILQEPIKAEMGLSDTHLGLLSGFAFAVFYVICGIPIARWADRGVRRNIISLSIVIWSLMTAISGTTQNFIQLLLARIGVGVGEAGASPPAHSMISDIFPPEKRATALSLYSAGLYIGILAGFLLGGWINEAFGWRTAFMVVGLPGVLLAFVVFTTVKEPARGWSQKVQAEAASPPFTQALKLLWSRRAFRHLALGAGLQAFVSYGLGNWMPSYFWRTFGAEGTDTIGYGELATWLGFSAGLAGAVGTLLGGYITDRLAKIDQRWYLWLPAASLFTLLPVSWLALTSENVYTALILSFVPSILGAVYLGPLLAVTHGMVGLRMRALSSAIFFFVLNLIGLGLGPTIIGMVSDYLAPQLGTESLRQALIYVITCAGGWGAIHMLLATRTLREDLAKAPA